MSIPDSLPSAALFYAENGIPVFPLGTGKKTPLIKGWQHRATTDQDQVRRWWSKWPDANIGLLTGHASGIFVLDVDLWSGGFDSILDYQDQLPDTRIIKTGSGGLHYLFLMPEGIDLRNTTGKLGDGLDTRGTGGYVVAAGSVTERPYEVFVDLPMAPVPDWLIELLRNDPRGSESITRAAGGIKLEDTGPILEGTRNRTLFDMGCSLRGKGQDVGSIEDQLHEQNSTRCTPPLDTSEVAGIAQSVARYAPGTPANRTDKGTPEVRELLGDVDRYIAANRWSGMGEHSARDVLVSLVKIAREHGELHDQGVKVSVSVRALALEARVSTRTAQKAIDRLRCYGVLERAPEAREANQAGAFILQIEGAQGYHTHTMRGGDKGTYNPPGRECVTPARPYSAPRLRWSSVRRERVGDGYEYFTQRRLGKVCGKIIDTLEHHGAMRIEELAGELHMSRARDLRRRHLQRLIEAGIIEVRGDTVALVSSWREALELERTASGEVEAERLQAERYGRERKGFALELERRKLREARRRLWTERRSKVVSRT